MLQEFVPEETLAASAASHDTLFNTTATARYICPDGFSRVLL